MKGISKQISVPIEAMSSYDERTFYPAFIKDLKNSKKEVIIASPWVRRKRMQVLLPVFKSLTDRNVKMSVITRPIDEYKKQFQEEGEKEIQKLKQIGVEIHFNSKDNRVFAIIDRKISWDGSMHIFSYVDGTEYMLRIADPAAAQQSLDFIW